MQASREDRLHEWQALTFKATGKKVGLGQAFAKPRHVDTEVYAMDVIRKAARVAQVGAVADPENTSA